jgi:hypothetical protein
MSIKRLLLVAAAANAATIGFTSYKEIIAGADNSDAITYTELDRSSTLFLNIQIVAGEDNAAVIDDFRTLCENYGAQNVSVIPRVRYGTADGSMALEPEDSSQVLADVATWAEVFAGVKGTIDIPVLQAGFLGAWAEWHVRIPFSPFTYTYTLPHFLAELTLSGYYSPDPSAKISKQNAP